MKYNFSFLTVMLAAVFLTVVAGCGKPLPSRQKLDLKTSEYAKEAAFAVEAVTAFNKDRKLYEKYWTSHGDIYQSALRLLSDHPMKTPNPVKVYRFGSSENLIVVELAEAGHPGLAVSVWRANGKLSITDINPVAAKEKK